MSKNEQKCTKIAQKHLIFNKKTLKIAQKTSNLINFIKILDN